MTSKKFFGILLCVVAVGMLMPASADAQSSTFVLPLDRTGQPGTQEVSMLDPLTGQPTTLVVDTGAFNNPCTLEKVDIAGTSTITTQQTVDKLGNVKVDVSVISKGTGAGWIGDDYTTATFTGSNYSFSESQSFKFQLPTVGEEFSSDFSDKISMKGAKSVDNWVIRAHFKIKVSADGTVQVFMIKTNNDACKG